MQCSGDGGWGAIITSKKVMDCEFTASDDAFENPFVGRYQAVIRKYGLDIGKTNKTILEWVVFAPSKLSGPNYIRGALAGEYVGVAAEATVGVGVGANALIGGNDDQFALQPLSVQTQTGLGIAAGIETLVLTYVQPS